MLNFQAAQTRKGKTDEIELVPMEANDRISKKDWSQYFRLNRIKAPKYNSKQQASQVCLLSGNQRDIQVSI